MCSGVKGTFALSSFQREKTEGSPTSTPWGGGECLLRRGWFMEVLPVIKLFNNATVLWVLGKAHHPHVSDKNPQNL